jgi:4,5-dihydroxyphthalate decarboxylase
MPNLRLSLAVNDYDHVRDLLNGQVRAEGIELIPSVLPVEEIFYRTVHRQEWDIAEMSLAKYASMCSSGDRRLIGLPIFPSRSFRLSSIYVRRDGAVKTAADLRNRRIGVPEWAQTASIYTRGWLTHLQKIGLDEVEWVQAGVNQPGRKEKVELKFPDGLRYRHEPEQSLTGMLLDGQIDAIFSARAPAPPADRAHEIVRLYPDFEPAEREYFHSTGVFPIMHLIVMRRDVFEANRWIAANLITAFTQAKENSVSRLNDITCSHFPLPWMQQRASESRELFGDDIWPYGVEKNRTTLTTFLAYAFEHGICHRLLEPEALFPDEALSSVRV